MHMNTGPYHIAQIQKLLKDDQFAVLWIEVHFTKSFPEEICQNPHLVTKDLQDCRQVPHETNGWCQKDSEL